MKKLICNIFTTGLGWFVIGVIVFTPCAFLYLVQRTVCSEMQEIMRTSGSYQIFTGCVLEVGASEPIDLKEGMK